MEATDETLSGRTARRLHQARVDARMTVREAAERTGISHTLIVKYENGTVAPPLERLRALAAVYGLTLAALLAEQDAAMPVIAAIDQASAAQLAQLALLLEQSSATR